MELLLASLAVFFVWESVYAALPWIVPAWLQPLLVYGVAVSLLWPDWRLALATCGAVALLHVLVQVGVTRAPAAAPQVLQRRTSRAGVPDLP